jgi:hypothetical protein
LSSIQSLQDELKKTPECQNVGSKISTISKVLNEPSWRKVKEMLTSTNSPQLEAEEVRAISSLVSEATMALSDTVAQLSNGSSHCIPESNKAPFLSTLAGVVKEVSGVVGNVAGPYGASISLGGNLLSGVISGIDKLFKQNKVYNFNQPAEEMLFLNQFCAFTQAQQDINDFLHLEEKEQELLKLEQDYLRNSKIKDLVANCPECNAYKIAWDTNEEATRIGQRIIEDANIVESNINPSLQVSFTRCAEINRAFYSENSDFSQLITLLENYKNPLMSKSDSQQLRDLTLAMKKLTKIYPSYGKCIAMDNQAISIKFNNFMRDEILRLNGTIFGQQMKQFHYLANRSFRDRNGDYIALSLERAKWARIERDRIIKKIREPNYRESKEIVIKTNMVLKKRLIENLMPSYLKFRFKDNKKNISQFVDQFQKFKRKELSFFNAEMAQEVDDLVELTTALKLEHHRNLGRYFVSAYDQLFQNSNLIILKVTNNLRYCDYLLYSRSMTPTNRKLCLEGVEELKDQLKETEMFQPEIAAISEFDKWAQVNLKIQSSFVQSYADRIQEWNARGSSRWDRVIPTTLP